jgi:hypothetical protein
MKVAMMQPSFMPWQGFFELIYKSDIFIFLDNFQFSVQSYHQRNRLFVNKEQVDWYSVPVQKSISFKSPLNETKINESVPWRKKMWKRIQQNYGRTPYFGEIAPHIENWLFTSMQSLAEQNISFIKIVCSFLNFHPHFVLSSENYSNLQRSHRVIELIRLVGATCYLSAKGAFEYMFEDGVFPVKNITVLFQDFQPLPYPQICSDGVFVPYLSILDALMNIGPHATAELVKSGTKQWLTWDEMAMANNPKPKEEMLGN